MDGITGRICLTFVAVLSNLILVPVDPASANEMPGASGETACSTLREFPFDLLVCDYVQFKLARVDREGEITWEHRPVGKVWDFVLVDGSRLVYPIITDRQEVRCMDFLGTVHWSWPYRREFREIINITRDQARLIVSGQKPPCAVVMDFDGKIHRKISIPAKYEHHHGQLGNVYALRGKNLLAQLWGEGTALELDANGNEVWRFQVPRSAKGRYPAGTVQDVLRLDNGNTLIACGTQARLLEVNSAGKIVWEFSARDAPGLNFTNACSLQQLKDGRILVTNFLRGNSGRGAHAFLFSTDRKITWTWNDHENFTAASQVWAIESDEP